MTLYITVCRQAQSNFQSIFLNINDIYEGSLFLENLFKFLHIKDETTNSKDIITTSDNKLTFPPKITYGIVFENVSFKYPGREEYALRNINLHITAGERLAIVGTNGSGKTTLVKLLTRLYEPTSGRILLDGRDIREYDLIELRQRIGVIFQDFVHYYATLRENICYGRIDALNNTDLLLQASRQGGADTVAMELPHQFETMLGNWFDRGVQLSGGQWQKIALSRGFIRDSEIMILDEPTSALDAEHEYTVFQQFRELTMGKIAILISHRFSTVRLADRIIVINKGTITENGTHEELIISNGKYAKLFSMQAEGYK